MIQRTRRTLPATLVALALLAASLLVAMSCVQNLTGQPPWIPFTALAQLGNRLTVASPLVVAAAIAVGVAGLVLLGAAIAPGRVSVLPLDPGPTGLTSGATRRSLVHALRVAATDVDGVDKAHIRMGARRVRARIITPLHDPAGLREQVVDAITARLTDIAPTRMPTVHTHIKTRNDQP